MDEVDDNINATAWELEMKVGKAGGSEVVGMRGRLGRESLWQTFRVQLSAKRLSGTAWAIWGTGEAPILTTDQLSSETASPAAPETDTGEWVHSPSGINLWTTFKVSI